MAARKKRRRRGSVWRSVVKHRSFVLVLMLLTLLWFAYSQAIHWLKTYTARVAELQEKLNKINFSSHPEAYFAAQRSLDTQRLEPFFLALLLVIPLSFITVLIACIIKYTGRSSNDLEHHTMEYYGEIRSKRIERSQGENQP